MNMNGIRNIRKHEIWLFHGYLVIMTTYSYYIIHVCIMMFSKHQNGREEVEISGISK